MNKVKIISVLLLLTSTMLLGQKITMERIELVNNVIEVYYTLEDSNPNHEYQIDLYCSNDNFAAPVSKVTGDVGTEIKPGESLVVSWDVLGELGNFEGDISVEIRARVYIPFVKVAGFEGERKFKRGSTYPLIWTSGNLGGQVDIELYKENDRMTGDRNVPNSGKYEYAFAGATKPGKGYRLKFTNTRNRDEFVYTGKFRVIPRIPVYLKVGAIALAAVGTYLVIDSSSGSKKSSEGEGNNNNPDPLSDPPGFP